MTDTESTLFGQPTLLLGGDISPLPEFELDAFKDTFMPNGLLGDSPVTISLAENKQLETSATESSLAQDVACSTYDTMMDTDTFVPNGILMEPTSTAPSFEEERFVPTGLLGESVPQGGASGDVNAQGGRFGPSSLTLTESASQSQMEALPDIADILRPYTIASSSSSSSSTTSLKAITNNGKAVFLKRKHKRTVNALAASASSGQKFGKLLDVPIHRLLDELSVSAATKLSFDEAHPAQTNQQASSSKDGSLLTDRYRPKRFTELLGDDRVHREVMAWVKEWDHCVFGNKKGRSRKRPREDEEATDEWRRPKEKILLLSGPPGLGKTTLAHVVAHHAGYGIVEVNASDARTAQVVDERIRPALESGTKLGSNKPVLVVVDEIDGATGGGGENSSGFIQKLIQLTYDKPKKKGRKNDPQTSRPLLRPIICICNDLYASSLAKLRPIARIVRFSRPNDIHLVRRLRDICEREELRAESRALTTLVGVAQGDLRGCLNMLQFIKARGGGEVTEPAVRRATAGMKGADSSVTTVLNDLFTPISRKRAKELGITEEEEARYVSRLSRAVEDSGSTDRIALGCFEHYANLHQHDANFSRYLKANEWLGTFDIMTGEMRSEREYALMQYLAYPLVSFYPLFQERGAPRAERPKADWEHHVTTKMHEEIYKSLARNIRTAATHRQAGNFRHLASEQILQLEVAPLLNRIISPPLRPVNSQVIRPQERAILTRLVDIMAAMELRFVQEKSEDGQLVYRLDPPIDVFVTYDGKRAADIAISRYAMRHMVAAEVDAKLIARQAEVIETDKPSKANFFGKTRRAADDDEVGPAKGDGVLMSRGTESDLVANKRARTVESVPAEKVAVDFFGRPILPKEGIEAKTPSGPPAVKYSVKYRFKEGNSSAVRKPVKVSAFM